MAAPVEVVVEVGKKKSAAYAPAWPGWSRGGNSPAAALETLASYGDRYRRVAALAGLGDEFPSTPILEVVEELPGRGMTSYWGISFSAATGEQGQMSETECERKLGLLRACWAYFDDVAKTVSAELRKGPRGGGRDREQILRHIFANERDWGRMIGLTVPEEAYLTAKGLRAHRNAYVEAIRKYNAAGNSPRTWRLQFLLRHTAYHVMDHAWEMEDKDLSNSDGAARSKSP
ncbi:MAG TPA: hypothetical protein VJ815_07985 [Acidimicrobiia bacterium]|nr:hypothetical protein [Acidimicrobiia bacterium]